MGTGRNQEQGAQGVGAGLLAARLHRVSQQFRLLQLVPFPCNDCWGSVLCPLQRWRTSAATGGPARPLLLWHTAPRRPIIPWCKEAGGFVQLAGPSFSCSSPDGRNLNHKWALAPSLHCSGPWIANTGTSFTFIFSTWLVETSRRGLSDNGVTAQPRWSL